jgi:hypothetical protein
MAHAQLILGLISVLFGVMAYYFYIRDILNGSTKPHAFSWLIWGLLAANGFIAQIRDHAGYGAWAILLTSSANLIIFALAVFKGDNRPSNVDWILLLLALISFACLFIIKNQVIGVWITLFALSIGFFITIKKSLKKPNEETGIAFLLNALKYIPAIFALQHFSFDTVAYPFTAFIGNALIIIVLEITRKKMAHARV